MMPLNTVVFQVARAGCSSRAKPTAATIARIGENAVGMPARSAACTTPSAAGTMMGSEVGIFPPLPAECRTDRGGKRIGCCLRLERRNRGLSRGLRRCDALLPRGDRLLIAGVSRLLARGHRSRDDLPLLAIDDGQVRGRHPFLLEIAVEADRFIVCQPDPRAEEQVDPVDCGGTGILHRPTLEFPPGATVIAAVCVAEGIMRGGRRVSG